MPYTSPRASDSLSLQKLLNKKYNQSENLPFERDISPLRATTNINDLSIDLLPPKVPVSSSHDYNLKAAMTPTHLPTDLDLIDTPEILKFARESTQLYSYAQLSQNSLALRLNVLKRSLEILSERPELFNYNNKEIMAPPFMPEAANSDTRNSGPTRHRTSGSGNFSFQSNASSALLSALFRQAPPSPASTSPSIKKPTLNDMASSKQQLELIENVSSDVEDIIQLLDSNHLVHLKSSQPQKVVNDLHDLSLLNLNDSKQEVLKVRLLHALATPFVENSAGNNNTNNKNNNMASTPTLEGAPMVRGMSTFSLSTLQYQPSTNNRPFHSMSTNKKITPQAIFTCDLDAPWSMKLANDLACLMFGVSRSSLRAFTLMDLILSRSRDFVLSKLLKETDDNSNGTVFAGEIIAIQRPNNNFAWTSVWGKRKENMMILIFDQIPCDSVDLIISKLENEFKITSFVSHTGSQLFEEASTLGQSVASISKSLSLDIEKMERSVDASSHVKRIRYYTINVNGKNVPCALTAVTLDSDSGLPTLKLNIHSMPYIAGTIVVSSKDHSILSYNAAACKNLFGHSSTDLDHLSIDFLIPHFTKLVQYLIENDHTMTQTVGLVLPEHYFRKLAAYIASDNDVDELEFLFLNSDGISAKHRDGNMFKVDVQLRVTSTETFMLWVTYSRSIGSKKNDKQVHFENAIGNRSVIVKGGEDPEVSEDLKHRQIDEEIDLPSQLRLLPANENEIQSCGSSTDGLSRSGSLRSPSHSTHQSSSSLDLKQEKMKMRTSNEATTPVRASNVGRVPSLSNSTTSSSHSANSTDISRTPPTLEYKSPMNAEELQQRSIHAIELNGSVHKRYSEKELLTLENDAIKEIQKKSVLWPKEVGLKRREKKLSDFIILKNMGEGAYGKVVLAQHKEDKCYKLIIKCIVKERILVDTWVRDRKLGTIPSEIQIMSTLNNNPHPNIMRIVDFFEDASYYYLETPQHGDPPGIDLFDLIELQTSMSELECKFIFRQIVQLVNHLHKNGIIHRDIKDENIIIDNQGIIKLIDFGSASYVRNGPFDVFVGTIDYASPEVLNGNPYEGKPQDVWAMGVLLYTLIYKENPFYNVDEIMEGELRLPFVMSDECVALIKRILDRDINKRPTMKQILEDPWLVF